MTNRQLKLNTKQKEEIITLGKKQMLQNQVEQTSYMQLFLSTIQFINKRVWILQIVLFLGTFLFFPPELRKDLVITTQSMTIILLFSLLFFINDLFKSFFYKMWELEQTFKYDLKQHIAMKLLVFGGFDLIVILVLSSFVHGQLQISLIRFALFLIVPFNIFCIILFLIFTLFRNKIRKKVLYIGGGVVIILLSKLPSVGDVYQQPIFYWIIATILSSIVLIALTVNMLQSYRPRRQVI